jgi:hypothetical protein
MAESPRVDVSTKAEGVAETWRRLNFEQRAAAVGALLLIVSTFGPFSFVEAAMVLLAGGVLYLLKQRADGRVFHLPFGDGTVILVAGGWAGLLILVRLFDRPLGQGLLALVCAAILVLAGIRERSKHPPDDLPAETVPGPTLARRRGPVTRRRRTRTTTPASEEATRPLDDDATRRMPGAGPVPEPEAPPEFDPAGAAQPPPPEGEEPTQRLGPATPAGAAGPDGDQLELLDDPDEPSPEDDRG